MRVLFWSERFWPLIGGVGIAARRLLPALRARGHEFLVLTARDRMELPEEDDLDGIPVIRLPVWTALAERDLAALAGLRQRVGDIKRSFRADLIHINFLGPSVFLHAQTRAIHPAPVLVGIDAALPPPGPGGSSLVEETLTEAAWVSCVSDASLAQLLERLPGLRDRSSVIRHGCEPPPFSPGPLPREPPHLVCLGRAVPTKGFDLALAAFAQVRDRFSAARLTVAGDGPDLPRLKRQAAELGIASSVAFPGWVAPSEIWALLDRATCVVVPSRAETFGLVALEAAIMARPVIAARVGGLPEVVVDGETGLLVAPDDVPALAGALGILLERPETAERAGRAARERALSLFSWEGYVAAYDALYRRIQASRSGG